MNDEITLDCELYCGGNASVMAWMVAEASKPKPEWAIASVRGARTKLTAAELRERKTARERIRSKQRKAEKLAVKAGAASIGGGNAPQIDFEVTPSCSHELGDDNVASDAAKSPEGRWLTGDEALAALENFA